MDEKPLDEYELLNEEIGKSEFSEYGITNSHRNYMLISSGVLLLSILQFAFGGFFPHVTGFTLGQNQVITVATLCASCYSLYFMRNYFKHFNLNALVQITWVMFMADIFLEVIYLVASLGVYIPESIDRVIGSVSVVSIIFWIAKVLQLKSKKYSEALPLKNAAKVLIFEVFFAIVSSIGAYFLLPPELGEYIGLSYLPIAVYYIFIIKFTLMLKIKEEEFHVQ